MWLAVTAGAFSIYHKVDSRQILSGVLTAAALATLAYVRLRLTRPRAAFAGTSVFLVLMLAAAGLTLYPYLIPAYPRGTGGITVHDASPAPESTIAITVIVAVALVGLVVYRTISARALARPAEK